jgi:hypothetical protein
MKFPNANQIQPYASCVLRMLGAGEPGHGWLASATLFVYVG